MTEARGYASPKVRSFVIYTAILDNYDHLRPAPRSLSGLDFVCFTNCIKGPKSSGWQIRPIPFGGDDSRRICRKIKICPHKYLPEYDISLWVDGNVSLSAAVGYEIIHFLLSESRISYFPHPVRDCIYKEAEACIVHGKDSENIIRSQMEYFRRSDFPGGAGLADTGVIFRHHGEEQVMNAMEEWWGWIEKYSCRDQLSLNYVLWKSNVPRLLLPGSRFERRGAFVCGMHRTSRIKSLVSRLETYEEKFAVVRYLLDFIYVANRVLNGAPKQRSD